MLAILGIDAAWTEREPTGVALLQGGDSSWNIRAVAPSYEAFVALSRGQPVDWNTSKFRGNSPRLSEVVEAAGVLASADIRIVAVDMPVATVPFHSRREADSAISREFGGRGCAAHSPSADRPGKLGATLMEQLSSAGFPLAVAGTEQSVGPCTIEVYPHPALLELLGCDYRVPYKVSRSGQYWPGASKAARIANLLKEFTKIRAALEAVVGPLSFDLPQANGVETLSELKRYEDALDAIICAWVGLRFSLGTATAYGDAAAAIWVPSSTHSPAGGCAENVGGTDSDVRNPGHHP